jgi:malonyl-CoA/methylmalonyl-CoA synthetase
MASTLPRIPIFEAIKKHDGRSIAVVHSLSGRTFTYGELVNDVAAAKDQIQRNTNGKSAGGERIAFLVENGYDYVGAHRFSPLYFLLPKLCRLTVYQ